MGDKREREKLVKIIDGKRIIKTLTTTKYIDSIAKFNRFVSAVFEDSKSNYLYLNFKHTILNYGSIHCLEFHSYLEYSDFKSNKQLRLTIVFEPAEESIGKNKNLRTFTASEQFEKKFPNVVNLLKSLIDKL